MKKTKILHFSVDGDFLTNLAREMFVDDMPKGAVKALTDSLVGFPEELAIEIVTGKKKLTGTDQLTVEDDCETSMYGIPLDFGSAWERLAKKYLEKLSYLQMLKRRISVLGAAACKEGALYRDHTEGHYCARMQESYTLAADRENYVALKKELDAVVAEMLYAGSKIGMGMLDVPMENYETTPDYCALPELAERVYLPFETLLAIDRESLARLFEDDERQARYKTLADSVASADVDDFVKRSAENDQRRDGPIRPNQITDMNDAGWLAPNGDWYGANGTIADMLHNQIADALVEAGIVPRDDAGDVNPDLWMLERDWCKVKGSSVLYEGYARAKRGGMRIRMSDDQKKALVVYGQHLIFKNKKPCLNLGYRGMCGDNKHVVSAAMFEMLDDDALEKMFDF